MSINLSAIPHNIQVNRALMPTRTASSNAANGGQAILAAAAAAHSAAFFPQQQQQQAAPHSGMQKTSFDAQRAHMTSVLSGNANVSSDYQPDRPIGYGAFGVVWSVTDPRDGKRVALKKLPNVFQSLVSSKRVFRELRMMRFFKHENVLSCLDILQVK